MVLITRSIIFSVLKNCKYKLVPYNVSRNFAEVVEPTKQLLKNTGDRNLLEISKSWLQNKNSELREAVVLHMVVIPDFITEAEETDLMAEIEPVLRRMRYEFDHWDNAIHGFRELERTTWRDHNAALFTRVRGVAFRRQGEVGDKDVLPGVHVLDLAAAGHIKPHVDAVRFCGEVIAGLCLLSPAVMRLEHTEFKELSLDALLPRRCLYIMSGVARYDFSHAVLGGEASMWRGKPVVRGRRVSIITRSRPAPSTASPTQPDPDKPIKETAKPLPA